MTSLNEEEKQLFETLLNQADAVAPATDKQSHSARDGSLGKCQLSYAMLPHPCQSVLLTLIAYLYNRPRINGDYCEV